MTDWKHRHAHTRIDGPACELGGCERAAYARGWCFMHYMRDRKSGFTGEVGGVEPAFVRGVNTPDKRWGYVWIWRGGVKIQEHRWVMQGLLGRTLLDHERVHHINGVRHDNRPVNLELWSIDQPPGQRVEDKVAWAKEILALYAPEALAS